MGSLRELTARLPMFHSLGDLKIILTRPDIPGVFQTMQLHKNR